MYVYNIEAFGSNSQASSFSPTPSVHKVFKASGLVICCNTWKRLTKYAAGRLITRWQLEGEARTVITNRRLSNFQVCLVLFGRCVHKQSAAGIYLSVPEQNNLASEILSRRLNTTYRQNNYDIAQYCTYVCLCMCMCICMYIYIYMHIWQVCAYSSSPRGARG